jgi:fructokinase
VSIEGDGRTVVGLGEVLWDLLPQGKQLGGAPANFAYMSALLGHRAVVASRVGADALGQELRTRLADLGVDSLKVETDGDHPTGTVAVHLDARGQPSYDITRDVAWDFLAWTPEWKRLAAEADVICFGSLAQRSAESCATIQSFLRASRPGAIRIFDVNLRQQFFSSDILAESLSLANVAKLNDAELPVVMRLLGLEHRDEKSSAATLRRDFGLELVSITRGSRGSVLLRGDDCDDHSGFAVQVADLVGAGDAFTAALAHHLLRESPLGVANAAANRLGAWVASRRGATPPGDPEVLRKVRNS